MAVNEKWMLESPGKLDEDTNTYYANIIIDEGAPDGDADPQASALKGSAYFRVNYSTDDSSPLYLKVDADSADDDWQQVMINTSADNYTRNGHDTYGTSYGIYFRDTGQRIYSPAANTGALALAASGDVWRIGDMTNSNYVQIDYQGNLTFNGSGCVVPTGNFQLWDDFTYRVIDETTTPWILNEGVHADATDPTISVQEFGVVQLVTGSDDGTTAADASQIVGHIPVQADSGGLTMEARLHINTAITNIAVFVGFTDSTALEEPFTNAADVITSTCSDGCGFLYDTDATTDQWWTVAVDTDVDDTGNAASGTAPTADTYQTFRIEVSSDGATINFYIDGALELAMSGSTGVSPDVNLYPTVIACGDGTASKTVDVDYIWVSHNR